MTERRGWKSWSAVALLTVAVLVLAAAEAPLAAKKYKEKDLKGDYHFVVTESRVDGAEIQYCDSYGTISFDGHGYAETVMSLRRCTWHPSGTVQIDVDDPGEFDYEVYPNGEFLLIELDDVTGLPTDYITHGRIVHDKDMLIVDGTRGCAGPPPACPHPEFLQTIAVGVKE